MLKDLQSHYDQWYQQSIDIARTEQFKIDPYLANPNDNRYGMTLLIRPAQVVKDRIQDFLSSLNAIAPKQYYYRSSDIHITVMSIISCYAGFNMSQIAVEEYSQLIQESLKDCSSFEITFKGITASPSTIMIQGFYDVGTLDSLRDQLRNHFGQADLQQSLDKRYKIFTAHATVVRFKTDLSDKARFLNLLEKYRNHEFGTFKVRALEFVFNDWYQRIEKVSLLKKFVLH